MLAVRQLESGYGKKQVLFGISLEVQEGEIVAIIGPNGSGKSTILKAVSGLIPIWKGEVYLDQTLINGSTPAENAARRMAFSPQGNRVFDELTVRENLEIGGFQLAPKLLRRRIDEILEMFPVLKERLPQEAGKLSGGQQQMLALARVLIPQPKLLMLDEPSAGLSPNLSKTVFEKISQINRDTGIAILVVEQRVRDILEISHRVYSIKQGAVAFSGQPTELIEDQQKLKKLFL